MLLGVFLILFSAVLIYQRYNPNKLAFSKEPETINYQSGSSLPHKLIIKDLDIDVDILAVNFKDQKWVTTDNGVSYLTSSAVPGEVGNSILYGHNYRSLLGNLTQAKVGQKIEIMFEDGSKKEFIINYTTTVDPSKTALLENSSDSRVTIYTCTGFLDNQRFVVVAKQV